MSKIKFYFFSKMQKIWVGGSVNQEIKKLPDHGSNYLFPS